MISARQIQIAIEVARMSPLPLDRLPYTEEFEHLWREFVRRLGEPCPRATVFQCLLSVRKRGLLDTRSRRLRQKGGA